MTMKSTTGSVAIVRAKRRGYIDAAIERKSGTRWVRIPDGEEVFWTGVIDHEYNKLFATKGTQKMNDVFRLSPSQYSWTDTINHDWVDNVYRTKTFYR